MASLLLSEHLKALVSTYTFVLSATASSNLVGRTVSLKESGQGRLSTQSRVEVLGEVLPLSLHTPSWFIHYLATSKSIYVKVLDPMLKECLFEPAVFM
jgi:hypothetical protein